MSGLSSALNLGKSSLATHQKLIEVAGNNIANVNTPGYSRQVANLATVPALNMRGFLVGQGVTVSSVQREQDVFLTRQLRDKNAALGEQAAKTSHLTELERIFDIGDNSLSSRINEFFDAWQQLSANPGGSVERNAVLQQGALVADGFQTAQKDLQRLGSQIDDTLAAKLGDINLKLQQVADFNQRISTVEATGVSANSDRDQRDLLLQELSYSLGVQAYENSNGTVSVQLGNGLPLVEGNRAMSLEAGQDGDKMTFAVNLGSTTRPLDGNSLGGEFKGLLSLRDELIPQVQGQLDQLAHALVTEVNALHAAGTGQDGSTGVLFFRNLTEASGAAGNIGVAITDSRQLAAGQNAGEGDNRNALAMAALAESKVLGGTDTFTTFYGNLASRVGLAGAQNRLSQTGLEDTLVQLQNLRDSKVGVSLEEEMINLIQFQRGFEASAKLLTTVDEMMETVLSIKR